MIIDLLFALLIGMNSNVDELTNGEIINEKEAYIVTEIKGEEIHGENLGNDGTGIFIYKSESKEELKEGDKIIITFGEYEDVILNVEKLKMEVN